MDSKKEEIEPSLFTGNKLFTQEIQRYLQNLKTKK